MAPEMSEKFPKTINNGLIDPNSTTSDHVVAILKLKETIAGLNKKLQQKDNGLLQKDKEVIVNFKYIDTICHYWSNILIFIIISFR